MTERPNFLLFLTDDHAPWAMGCYGNSEVRSPTFDRLAHEGVRFSNAFTPTPVCSPGRACLLTGRTSSQTGIHDWISRPHWRHDWLADETTLAEILDGEGYVCGLSGKWHLGRDFEPPRGFSYHFGISGSGHNSRHSWFLNRQALSREGNKTRFITDHALEFLGQVPSGTPFFLLVGYVATHSPYTGHRRELVSRYDDATFQDIPTYQPHPWHKNEDFPQGTDYTESDIRIRHQNQYAAVTEIDQGISRLVERLRERGQLDNTVIIYTSDHGLALGHKGFWGKGNGTRPLNMYEVSIRVPLIMYGPAPLGCGVVVDHCVDHWDTFQTVCDLAGVDLGEHGLADRSYPGRSFLDLVSGGEIPDWRETRFGEYGDLRMIRTPRYKLVKRYPDGPDDLFDLESDPDETVNLAGTRTHARIQRELLDELQAFLACHEEPSRSGLRVKELRQHNAGIEAWRDGIRESRGLQVY